MVGIDQLDEGPYWITGNCLLVNRGGRVLVAGLFRLVTVAKDAVNRAGIVPLMRTGNSAGLLIGKIVADGKDEVEWR